MVYFKNCRLKYIIILFGLLVSCGKNGDTPATGGGNGGGGNGGNNHQDTNCIITAISQVNSGAGAESSLSISYNSNYEATKLILYDSVNKSKTIEVNFNYVSGDSIRINPYQYIMLDGQKRVIKFVTKSDMTDPVHADNYIFKYGYNSDGYLETKQLFINNSTIANFYITYTYSGNQLVHCLMTSPGSGDLKVLESTLSYSDRIIKDWIYTFPDAMEGYVYLSAFNFGKHVSNPLEKVVTAIYEPVSGKIIDTWTTNYGNYTIDDYGYVLSGEANGDMQQGIGSFYGKTNFYYDCH